jgi:hypothetical protein
MDGHANTSAATVTAAQGRMLRRKVAWIDVLMSPPSDQRMAFLTLAAANAAVRWARFL